MNVKRWIARREADWQSLDRLLQQAEQRGLRSLHPSEVKQLASLYRAVTADLARARTQPVGTALAQDLQALVTRSYSQIYQGSRRQDWQAVLAFYRYGFPAIVQETFPYILLATGLFGLGGLIGWWFAWGDPTFLELLVPPELIRMVRDDQELWMGSILGTEPLASSSIMINNLQVSFVAIFGGVTMFIPTVPLLTPPGVFTIYILFMNGLLIGAIATLVGQNGLGIPFWAFVFPHGALELPAIFLAGAAGLLLARGILWPGRYRRRDTLRLYALKAAKLVYGIVPLLVIAGIIEGFFSPSPLVPNLVKYAAGGGLFTLLVIYCRQRPEAGDREG